MPKIDFTYDIEAVFENAVDDSGRVDTTTITMEHQDFFIAINHLIDEYYPARLIELRVELVEDGD